MNFVWITEFWVACVASDHSLDVLECLISGREVWNQGLGGYPSQIVLVILFLRVVSNMSSMPVLWVDNMM